MRVRRKYIQSLVNQILSSNNIESAPVDLGRITKALEIEVIKQDADDKIAGFLVKDFDNKNALIGVNKKHHLNRQRFTIAHEIGHYFLHNYQGVHFDGKNTGLQMYLRDDNSATGLNIEEREANLFAAELLMPEHLLEKDVSAINEIYLLDEEDLTIKKLAAKYKVSVRALTYRLSNLGYIKL
jgi:Zn-dependent peptidase ImmA (M78 family)